MTTPEGPPWLSLPADLGGTLRPYLPAIVAEIMAAVPGDVPLYASLLDGPFGRGVRRGVLIALNRFLDLPGTAQPALPPAERQMYSDLGRGEMTSGRTMEALLTAYRSGARSTFRGVATAADKHGYSTAVLIALGESIFAYIDELSAASVEGYAMAQSERAGEYEHRRAEVAEMLIRGEADEELVLRACAVADWRLPEHLVAILLPAERIVGLRTALGPAALVLPRTEEAVVLAPAPRDSAGRADLDRHLAGRSAVVGPARPWQNTFDSLRMATAAAGLRPDPARPVSAGNGATDQANGAPLWVDDHLASVILGAERTAMEDLARVRLAPLTQVRATQRERLTETLLSWLKHRGQRAEMAADLTIHPQTVGYRVAQLKRLFGADLDDPDIRFELEVVLRSGLVDWVAPDPGLPAGSSRATLAR